MPGGSFRATSYLLFIWDCTGKVEAVNTEMTNRLGTLPTPPSSAIRGTSLLVLLGLELLALTMCFDTQGLTEAAPWWAPWLGYVPACLQIGLAGVAAFLVIVGSRLPTLWLTLLTPACRHRWGVWLAGHGVACGVFTLMTAAIFIDTADVRPSLLWPVFWMLSAAVVVLLWLGALAPASRWWTLVHQEYAAMLGASLLGVGAWGSGQLGQALWAPLAETTLWVVRSLLALVYSDVYYDLAEQVVGTATFQVVIVPACSGYEGIGCVTLLLTLYLWWFRTHLRFPQALLLLPVGAVAAWVANALRLTTLIALGTSFSPAVAQGGFHSQAGWLTFLLVGLGLIAVTQRYHLFTVATPSISAQASAQYATALLMPLLVLLTTMVVTSALSSGFDWLYPLRVVTTSVALWSCRTDYRLIPWTWSWHAIGLGMAICGMWMLLEPADHHRATVLADGLAALPGGLAVVWVGFRVLGSALIVPIAEELAFRGYVIRKLVAPDFATIRPGQFTWWACLVSSVLFGVLHGRWLAGTLAGIGYALALRQRGQLADAIVAHMTTNALLAAYVLSQHAWSLWE
jgi:exosortase E/protease (VPEID-CTERM system)